MSYDSLLEVMRNRRSVRRLRSDPIPDGHVEKILEAARWAMSGANSQPWEFIVVKDSGIRKKLADAYIEQTEYMYWMEQMRTEELRQPHFRGVEWGKQLIDRRTSWKDAPVVIAVVGDSRRQFASVLGAFGAFGKFDLFSQSMATTVQVMHLAAASLGLGSQWVSITLEGPFKRVLRVPDILHVYVLFPIGYPAIERRPGYRRELKDMVHHETYDMNKLMTHEDILEYIRMLRDLAKPRYEV